MTEKAVSNPSAPSLAAHVLANLKGIRTAAKIDPGSVVEAYSFRKEDILMIKQFILQVETLNLNVQIVNII